MASLEEITRKVRNFYANIDPSKPQNEMDEISLAAYQHGEATVNAQLMAKYGMDLNTFASDIPTARAIPAYPQQQQQQYVVAGRPYPQQQVAQPQVIYVQANNPTAFSSQQYYAQQNAYHTGYNQGRRDDDVCCCLALLGLFCCLY